MHTLSATRKRFELPQMLNRVRRVIRDEISCGNFMEVQNIRFDLQIVCPKHYTISGSERHLAVVQRMLKYMLKGETMRHYVSSYQSRTSDSYFLDNM